MVSGEWVALMVTASTVCQEPSSRKRAVSLEVILRTLGNFWANMMALNNPAGPPPQIMVSARLVMVKVAEGGLASIVFDVGVAPTVLDVAHKDVVVLVVIEYMNGSIGRPGLVVAGLFLVDASIRIEPSSS
jgi:hypothetical protein